MTRLPSPWILSRQISDGSRADLGLLDHGKQVTGDEVQDEVVQASRRSQGGYVETLKPVEARLL